MTHMRIRNGYIFLLTVLVTGAISMAIVISLLLLSIAAERTGLSLQQSSQSFALAQLCAEHALLSLHEDLGYTGDEQLERSYGTCDILVIGGSGNSNRTICTEGISGNTVRRFEILVRKVIPSVEIYSWQEVELFTACAF